MVHVDHVGVVNTGSRYVRCSDTVEFLGEHAKLDPLSRTLGVRKVRFSAQVPDTLDLRPEVWGVRGRASFDWAQHPVRLGKHNPPVIGR